MRRITGCVVDASGHATVREWSNVRTSHAREIRRTECVGKIVKPVRIRKGIVIDVSDNFSSSGLQPNVARPTQTSVLDPDQTNSLSLRKRGQGLRRSVVDHNDFIVWIVLLRQVLQTLGDRKSVV